MFFSTTKHNKNVRIFFFFALSLVEKYFFRIFVYVKKLHKIHKVSLSKPTVCLYVAFRGAHKILSPSAVSISTQRLNIKDNRFYELHIFIFWNNVWCLCSVCVCEFVGVSKKNSFRSDCIFSYFYVLQKKKTKRKTHKNFKRMKIKLIKANQTNHCEALVL